HATLKLLRNALSDQNSIQIRLPDFFDVDMHWHTHTLADISTQFINVFAFLTNHNAWTGGVNSNASGVSRALDINAADRSTRQLSPNVLTHFQTDVKFVCVLSSIGIPNRRMLFDDPQTNTVRMYFLTHNACSLTCRLL